MPPDLAPMLAERGLPKGSLDRWAVKPKLDGWRVTVLVDERVVVRTRRGHAITDTAPGIDALAASGHRLLLDGELVANAGRASDFYALLPRVAGRRPRTPLPFTARREVLGAGRGVSGRCEGRCECVPCGLRSEVSGIVLSRPDPAVWDGCQLASRCCVVGTFVG